MRKEGKNMDRPPRPRLCFTHPEQNERESEREGTRRRSIAPGIGSGEWDAGGRPSDTGDATAQKPGRCTLLAH